MAKINPDSGRSKIAAMARQIADHQARIQVIGSNWGADIVAALDASEKKFLASLNKELDGFEFRPDAAETLKRLEKISSRLSAIRQDAYSRARQQTETNALELADNEAKWSKRITRELTGDGDLRNITEKQTLRVVNNSLAGGRTVQEWFGKVAGDEAARVGAMLNQGVASGWTIDQMARNIAGTAANNYTDGIFHTSRREAENMARTITNGIANSAKEAFYRQNQDVITGVEILATLDGRTCPVCASLDRKRYKMDEPHPSLPIHNNCRCVLLPVTPASDSADEARPMANADFNAEARRLYEKKYPKKNYDDLADSTRKKYYYQAMAEYERRTGRPAYTQSDGAISFRDYFRDRMTEEQRRDWLGPERYAIWKRGNLPLDKFIPPYPNHRLTVKKLKELDQKSFRD